MNKYIESVMHLKKKLEKGVSYEKTLHILHKLQMIPITIELLSATGIGKTVRTLSKQNSDTDIGKTAKLMTMTWKSIVKEQQEQEEQEFESHQDYEEPDVKVEPDFEQCLDSNPTKGYESNGYQREHNGTDGEDNGSNDDFKSEPKRRSHNGDLRSDKKHKKHKSSHKSRESESNANKTEFEELLGLNDQIIKNHKKSSNKRSSSERQTEKHRKPENSSKEKLKTQLKTETLDSSESKSHTLPYALDSKSRLNSLEHTDILSSLPTPNYRPLPNRELIEEKVELNRRKSNKTTDDLSINVQSRKGRTAVFAGHARTKTYTHVHPLEDLCIRVLMDNIDKIWYLGDAPYFLLKPVLQKCNPRQLSRIEKFNAHIMTETDELWKEFCKKEYRGQKPDSEDDESWRELYFRCGKERDDRLKNITKNISHKQAKALPVRQTQFSENVKTPREILRKQEKSGISHSISGTSGSGNSAGNYSLHAKIVPERPKVAPLMKKALKLQRARYRK